MRYGTTKFFIGAAIMIVAALFIFPLIVMLIWNAVMPDVFGVNEITYWQSLGLIVLGKILFSGFGFGRHKRHHHGGHWRSRWQDKWEQMSPEEQDAFYKKYGYRCTWKRKREARDAMEVPEG
jgi:hypothetical protein